MSESWSYEFYKLPNELKAAAISTVKEVLLKRANAFAEELKRRCPVNTGGLRNSIKVKEVKPSRRHPDRVGYEVVFDGYDKHNRPYQVIANSLNFGYTMNNGKMVRTSSYRFMAEAHAVLRGIDKEIDAEWERTLERMSQNGN